jgi:hypothetical protein
MTPTQLPFLAEGLLILATVVAGTILGRAGKPYGKLKLVVHIFLYLWFTTGLGFIVYGLSTTTARVDNRIWVLVLLMCLMDLIQLGTGISMIASRRTGKTRPMIHITSMFVMAFADVCAYFIAGI